MSRILTALALLYALASPVMAARHRPVCLAVDVEGIPARICPPARRR
ncbi:hypothetical protein [Methylobacterium sp. WL6]|nr:hypothetical protein [Methylobacterium sp. WL6]